MLLHTLPHGKLSAGPLKTYLGLKNKVTAVVTAEDNPITYIEDGEAIVPPYVTDADTLEGHPASDFAFKSHNHPYSEISGKPSTFPPSSHTHTISQVTNLQSEITSLKTSVSNGKSAVASAITDKGVSTSATAPFDTMASNIRGINTGHPSGLGEYVTVFMKNVSPSIGEFGATPGVNRESVLYDSAAFSRWYRTAPPWVFIVVSNGNNITQGSGNNATASIFIETLGTVNSTTPAWDDQISRCNQKILLLKSKSPNWYTMYNIYSTGVSVQIQWDDSVSGSISDVIKIRYFNSTSSTVTVNGNYSATMCLMLPVDSTAFAPAIEVH